LTLVPPEIANTGAVTKIGLIETASAFLRMDMNDVYIGSLYDPQERAFMLEGNAYSPSSDFVKNFPNEFKIPNGRYPRNSSEIAISIVDAEGWAISMGRIMNYIHIKWYQENSIFRGVFRGLIR
jgi:hypothetical protein